MRNRILSRFFICCLLVAFAALNWYCGKNTPPAERTTYAGLSDTASYVGMQTCKGCHSDIHATFVHTGMGSSFDRATKQKSAGDFEHHPVLYDQFRDFYYQPYWNGDSLHFKEFRLEGKDTVYQQDKTINYIVGSGQHTNSHMWEQNGYVFQAPMTFYTQRQMWDLPPGFEDGNNTRFARIIGQECMTCHNAYPKFVAGSENKYEKIESGIDCERCHGPGSIHVREKSMGILIDTSKQIDYSIVNPAKLPMNLQLDICQRCHIQGNAVVKEGKSFFDFKPGMQLSDVMDVYMPVYQGSEEEHIMASHAERLRMSKCFTTSLEIAEKANQKNNTLKPYKNALTCVTCHNPHVSVKVTGVDHFKTACLSCHSTPKVTCSLSMEQRLKKQDNCVNCHMPMNNASDIPHVSVHDHRIGIHVSDQRKNAIKKFAGINCINNSNPSKRSKAEAYINYAEKFALGSAMLDSALRYIDNTQDADLLVAVYYLKKDWLKVIQSAANLNKRNVRLSPYDMRGAWTAYRVGEAYEQMNDAGNALNWYNKAVQSSPLNPQFRNKYASALITVNRNAEAFTEFAAIVKEHPYFAPALSNYGYLLLTMKNDPAGAMTYYDRALKIDPDYTNAILNKAGLYLYRGDVKSALSILKLHLKHTSDKEQILALIRQIEKGA